MPTYEYRCVKCSKHTEVVQSFAEDPLTVCPSCGGALKKVFGSIGVVFKGSGFYKTDNRRSTSAGSRSGATDSAKPKESSGKPESSGSGEGASTATPSSESRGGTNKDAQGSTNKGDGKAKTSEAKSA